VIKTAKDSGAKIDEARIWKWTTQLLCALGKLHTTDICHRAIKPANIFLDAEDNVRLGDQLTGEADMTEIGDVYYMCPEVARKIPFDNKCDTWALGCVLHELMTLEKPFLGVNALEVLDTLKHVRPADISSKNSDWHLIMLSRWMLQKNAEYRPSSLDVYSFLAREWKRVAKDGLSAIKPEDVPWPSDVVMADEGKMALDAASTIGMKAEERAAMPDKKDVDFENPFVAKLRALEIEEKAIPSSTAA